MTGSHQTGFASAFAAPRTRAMVVDSCMIRKVSTKVGNYMRKGELIEQGDQDPSGL